jgi:hypothetical protein
LRLREDKLRMLRAVRFAANFGFAIEPETLHAIQELAADVMSVSAERIGAEIRRMLIDPNRAVALRLLRETGLLTHVLPEVASLAADEFDSMLHVAGALRAPTLPLALAALLSSEPTTGRPADNTGGKVASTEQRVPSVEHPAPSTEDPPQRTACRGANTENDPPVPSSASKSSAYAVGRRLRYTNKEIERADWLLTNRAIVAESPQTAWPRLQRVLTHEGAAELLALHEALAGPTDPALAFCRERLTWPPEKLNPPPLLSGTDLIAHGLAPGPQFAALLEKVRDAQLNGEITTREEALALVDRLR